MDEQIQQIVDAYNATEKEQAARLRELFYILKARTGRRYIKFDGQADMLDNCWDLPDRLDGMVYLDRMNRAIVEVEQGIKA
jgi:hypothetical protein